MFPAGNHFLPNGFQRAFRKPVKQVTIFYIVYNIRKLQHHRQYLAFQPGAPGNLHGSPGAVAGAHALRQVVRVTPGSRLSDNLLSDSTENGILIDIQPLGQLLDVERPGDLAIDRRQGTGQVSHNIQLAFG